MLCVVNSLILNILMASLVMILPPGLSDKASLKTHPQEKLSFKTEDCKKGSSQKKSCPSQTLASQGLDLTDLTDEEALKVQEYFKKTEALQHDKAFQASLEKDLEKLQNIFAGPSFQEVTKNLQAKSQGFFESLQAAKKVAPGEFYIFVSLSMGEKALLNLAQEAKQYGAILVLRGFKEGSYAKTAYALQDIILKTMSSGDRPGEGQGIIIDPELFTLFSITAVPTFILTKPVPLLTEERLQTPLHDRLQGHVSFCYALESFAKEGDLKAEAQMLLQQIPAQKEQTK